MSRFRKFIEQHDKEKDQALRDLYAATMKVFVTPLEFSDKKHNDNNNDITSRSLNNFGSGIKVLGALQKAGVFGESGMGKFPELRDNEIEVKNWLHNTKPSGADFTIGHVLELMFGDSLPDLMAGGKEPDSAKAKVPPQPPVNTEPQSKPNMQQPQAVSGPPQPPMPGGPPQNLPPAPMGVQQGLF
jgi:hypothetical protein